jgi:hypothetical protein
MERAAVPEDANPADKSLAANALRSPLLLPPSTAAITRPARLALATML